MKKYGFTAAGDLAPVRRMTAVLIILCVLLSTVPLPPAQGASFSDVPESSWAYPYVEAAVENGWVEGVGHGRFNPDGLVSAAEFCAVLIRTYFPDDLRAAQAKNPGSEWWRPVMDVAWDKLMISSYGGHPAGDDYAKNGIWNKELVNAPIDRYEIANILSSMCVLLGMHTNVYPLTDRSVVLEHYPADGQEILDSGEINTNAVAVTAFNGLMQGTGDGRFSGDKTMTRAEMATAAVRIYEKEKNITLVAPGGGGSDVPQTDPGTGTGSEAGGIPPFAFQDENETVQQMMDRINAATPPYRAGYLTDGRPITAGNIEEMLQEIADDWAGEKWDASGRYYYCGEPCEKYYGAHVDSGACNSFAATVLDYLFGEDGPVTQHKNFDDIKPGDAVWIRDSEYSGHVVVVMGSGDLGACPDEYGYFWVFDGNNNRCVGQPYSKLLGHSNYTGSLFTDAFRENSIVYTRYERTETPSPGSSTVMADPGGMSAAFAPFSDGRTYAGTPEVRVYRAGTKAFSEANRAPGVTASADSTGIRLNFDEPLYGPLTLRITVTELGKAESFALETTVVPGE